MAPQDAGTKSKGEKEVQENLGQRRSDIKSRLDSLRNELAPLVTRVESLRERIGNLEDDFRDVLDQIREEEKKARKQK
jgi:predicted  nucleic acid-binding Zn-ribbon protein